MAARSWQVAAAVAAWFCGAGLDRAAAAASDPAGQLRSACDALVASAVQRRYGSSWPVLGEKAPGGNSAMKMDLAPGAASAAGLVLHLAGTLLNEPRFSNAALQAARGLAAAQERTGRVPAVAVFSAGGAAGRDEPSPVPDRAPTRAALGLWLTILQSQHDRDPRIAGAAARAAGWLLKQQGRAGPWTTQIDTDQGVERVIKLDNPDYRDCTFAVLLAARVTPAFRYTAAADRAAAVLARMRIEGAHPLWGTLYTGEGALKTGADGAREGVNALASRYAMQTLLAHALVTGSASSMQTLTDAATVARALGNQDGTWSPTYVNGQPTADDRGSAFAAPRAATFGLPQTLAAIDQARVLTPANYVGLLKAGFGFDSDLALALVGLSDSPMAPDFPVGASEVTPYLTAHPEFGADLDRAGVPEDLAGKVNFAYRWLVRTRLEGKRMPPPPNRPTAVTSDKPTS